MSHYDDILDEEAEADLKTQALDEMRAFVRASNELVKRRQALVEPAKEALKRLTEMCKSGSGQTYKVRAMLFSLWNGKPADWSDLLSVDFVVREDVLRVALAFGFENGSVSFFYDELERAFALEGLRDWFLEEGGCDE